MTSPRAFVGYKSQDRSRVSMVVDTLGALGYEVFWDQEIAAADVWRNRITTELAASDIVVVCWSKQTENAGDARWLLDEADEALRLGKKLCPIQLEPCTIPMGFRQIQTFVLDDVIILEQQLRAALDRPAAIESLSHPKINATLARELWQILKAVEQILSDAQRVMQEADAAVKIVHSGEIDTVELSAIEWGYKGQVRGPLLGRKPHGYGVKTHHYKEVELKGLFENGDFVVGAKSFEDNGSDWTVFAKFRGEIAQSPLFAFKEAGGGKNRTTAHYVGEASAGKPHGIGAVFDENEQPLFGRFEVNPLEDDVELNGWFARPLEENDMLRLVEYRDGEVAQEVDVSESQLERLARLTR